MSYADFGSTWEAMIGKAETRLKKGWTAEAIIIHLDQENEVHEQPTQGDWQRFCEWIVKQSAEMEERLKDIEEESLTLTVKLSTLNDLLPLAQALAKQA